uniref:Fumarate hydratase n=1 Tax=Staphylothermus marinus TaxID=2280 RepID=A0A7C4NVE3_STAMA
MHKLGNIVEQAVVDAFRTAVIKIPPDVKNALEKAYVTEDNQMSRSQLEAILKNIELAVKLGKPVCQDTGTPYVYVKVGYGFPIELKDMKIIEESIINGVKRATKEIPLRPNTVDPFTGKNPGDNTGRYMPIIHYELVDSDSLEITVVPKGGGSEYVSVLEMPPPGEGIKAVKRIVVDAVLKAGSMPCPPTVVGVGVGGGSDTALFLAKKAACIRKLGTVNPDSTIDKLEKELYTAINKLGIGAMGLGGRTTVLAVHIDYAYKHPANLPVGVVFQCWALRRATAIISSTGEYSIHQ